MVNEEKGKLFGVTKESLSTAKESLMCRRILDNTTQFYSKPENAEAFNKWLTARECEKKEE